VSPPLAVAAGVVVVLLVAFVAGAARAAARADRDAALDAAELRRRRLG